MHKYIEEEEEFELLEMLRIEVVIDPKTKVLDVKKAVVEELDTEIPLKELYVCS